ncbi:MAG: hypothetical protein CMJ94_03190 [Planctomycetes bacterium]|nr:hypothetical protein [Planctomycetota bacterium]
MPLAFIGGVELLMVLLVGLLLFGGKLPDIAKDLGRTFFKAKRSLDEIRRESGIDDALRDLERESRDLNRTAQDIAAEARAAAQDVPDWRQALDPSAGPDHSEAIAEAEAEAGPESETGSEATSGPENPDSEPSEPEESTQEPAGEAERRRDSQQSAPESNDAK